MKLYKAIIFDFDGTLVDSGPGIITTLKAMIQELNLRNLNDDELRMLVGPPINTAFPEVFQLQDAAELERVLDAYRRIFNELALPSLQLFPGVMDMLRDIAAAGIATGVATCKIQSTCEKQAALLHIDAYLDSIFGARPDAGLLEKEDILQEALRKMRIPKEDILMVGDRMYDIIGANAVGIDSIGVTYGMGTEEELLAHKPTCIVHSVAELHAFLLNK